MVLRTATKDENIPRRLVYTNMCPVNASNSRCSRTIACRLSKLLRMLHGVRHRYQSNSIHDLPL